MIPQSCATCPPYVELLGLTSHDPRDYKPGPTTP